MSVFGTVDLSAAIARLHQRIDPHCLPSKRKLEDYVPHDSDDDDDIPADLLRMRKPVSSPLPSSAPAAVDHGLSTSTSSSSSSNHSAAASSVAPTLRFFVRVQSRSLVIHARPDDTANSVIEHIKTLTGIPPSEQRLIYRGRALPDDCTLGEYAVERDSCLQLVGRLRSTKFPHAWQTVNDMISAVCSLNNSGGLDCVSKSREKSVESLLKEFLSRTPILGEGEDNTWGHLQVFVHAGAPACLVKLYLSPVPSNKALAERSIRLFLDTHSEYLPDNIRNQCAQILLEFCKILAGTSGNRDPLYLACRSCLATVLVAKDSRYFIHSESAVLINELFPFVSELVERLIAGLSTESMKVCPIDLLDFSNFLLAMRHAIQDWMGESIPIPRLLYCGVHPQSEDCIGSLHALFLSLLEQANLSLGKVGDFLSLKGAVQSEMHWAAWAHLLVVLTGLHSFSRIFEGGAELLHIVLLSQRSPLNALVRRAKRSDSFRWLLKHKDVTDFEARQNLVLMMLPEGKNDFDELHEMLIDRSQLLSESFEYIGQAEASALHGGLFMEFKNEEATGPGVLREWFCVLCRAIFNPQNVLFVSCPNDRRRFFPNPASAVDPLHLKYFGFCGRVIALALMHKVQVGIVFDRVFFLQLAGKSVTLEDVQDADPCLYMSCKKILEMDAELLDSDVLGLTFIRDIEELGSQRAVELCPGGKDIIVNSKNRAEYVNLLIQHRFVTSISEQVSHFAQGFGDILSSSKLQRFFFQSLDLEDFDRMIGGSDSAINVRDWKAHTEYNGYKANDRQICWFWKIVEGMPAEQKRVLLFFWTSVKYLPVDGFGGLASKLYIYKSSDSNGHLPTSHTCFYRLCLPPYKSISVMRDRLQLITQEHVSCTFGNW